MHTILHIGLLLSAYIIGSIPTAVWIGRKFFEIDIREHGSGNAGATNTIRVLGWKAGMPVLLFDTFKGFAAVNLIHFTKYYTPGTTIFINVQLILGIAAVIGHIFPLYTGFKGGKGVATLLGVVLAIIPMQTILALGVFMISFFTTKYVSLSSILAGVSFPIFMIFIYKVDIPSLIIFSLLVAILLVLTHRKNIGRIVRGEENKAKFKKSKVNSEL